MYWFLEKLTFIWKDFWICHDLSQGKQTINATTIYRYLNQRLFTNTQIKPCYVFENVLTLPNCAFAFKCTTVRDFMDDVTNQWGVFGFVLITMYFSELQCRYTNLKQNFHRINDRIRGLPN